MSQIRSGPRPHGMNTVARRTCLALLALYGACTGLWGYVAPESWYRRFPGLGMSWLPRFGPFNEHFVKDLNAMALGLAVLAIAAFCWTGTRSVTYLAGAGWLTFNGLHLIFHLRHLDMLGATDRIAGVVSLVLVVVLAALLLVPLRGTAPAEPGRPRIVDRAVFAVLFVVGAITGGWAYFAPGNWYATFPGFGRSWLPPLGPFNAHFAIDVGAAFLAYAVLSLIAFVRAGDVRVVRVTGLAWLVFNVLHLIYHLSMLGMYDRTDQVINVVGLSIVVVLPIIVLFRKKQGERGSHVDRTQSGTPAAAGRVGAGARRLPGVDPAGEGDQEGR